MQISFRLKKLIQGFRKVVLQGSKFYCPLCNAGYSRFLVTGVQRRPNARCPGCDSLERHRLLWVALEHLWKRNVFKSGGRMLHVAPEQCLRKQLEDRYDYVSVDMFADNIQVRTDITALCFPDNSFDAIICNHVLEHVPADRTALAELYRVLKHGGWGSIQVPMETGETREDLSIVDPVARERLYGQSDHVRQYGDDFRDRLRDTGFEVLEFKKEDLLDHQERARLSVDCEDCVILVRKLSKV